jgi:ppGpp synthetase/RelA/SpoT-type nucleotidyltranferase
MPQAGLSEEEERTIDDLVDLYKSDIDVFRMFTEQLRTLVEIPRLKRLYHSARWRVKEPDHLKNKLIRKLTRSRLGGSAFTINRDNLFEKVNDLAGIRLLHLHTSEFESINQTLTELLHENRYTIVEGPEARTWDDEYRAYFEMIGVKTVKSSRMYTSVHYVVEANTRTKRTAEIQVRTLAEELWGEVDHTINYPLESQRLACREQIKVLARLTSSCSRLVDSIFATHSE